MIIILSLIIAITGWAAAIIGIRQGEMRLTRRDYHLNVRDFMQKTRGGLND